jgi:transmembrane protein EpsG
MIATTLLGITAMLFAFLAKYKSFKYGLEISFFLIFLFLALRYNFGNDYPSYLNSFLEINRFSTLDLTHNLGDFEPGWKVLCRVFKPLGFFVMTAFLTLTNSFIFYRFIKKHVPLSYYWLAVFLYVFNPSFMLVHSSAMRQSIAIMIFVFALDYLFKKDAIRYFFCIAFAAAFHTSALILFPVFLLGLFDWRIKRITRVILVFIFLSLFMFGSSIMPYLNQFVSEYFERYEFYKDAGLIGSGLGVLYLFALFMLTLYYESTQNKKTALVFKIAIVSFIFIPLSLLIQLIGRVGMYFAPATIIVYPIILADLKKNTHKIIFLLSLILITIYGFVQFFSSEVFRDAFGTYQTIFSASQVY